LVAWFKAPDYKLEMKQTALELAERAVWRRRAQRRRLQYPGVTGI
jgi:hypothetical protein